MTAKILEMTETNPLKWQMILEHSPQMVLNLHYLMSIASDSEFSNGLQWYNVAHNECQRLSDEFNLPLEMIIGIVAILSPGAEWSHNLASAEDLIKHGDIVSFLYRGYGSAVVKAKRILNGEHIDDIQDGEKVSAFYRNILNPFDDFNVTVDTHAVRAVTLDQHVGFKNSSKFTGSAPKYRIVANVYRTVALEFNLLPLQVQAITWIVAKRLFGKSSSKFSL